MINRLSLFGFFILSVLQGCSITGRGALWAVLGMLLYLIALYFGAIMVLIAFLGFFL